MKHSKLLKAFAIVLAALSLTAAVGSIGGMWALTNAGLYEQTYEERYQAEVDSVCQSLAVRAVRRFASLTLGGCPEELVDSHYGNVFTYDFSRTLSESKVTYAIADQNGIIWECAKGANTTAPLHMEIPISEQSHLALVPGGDTVPEETFTLYYTRKITRDGLIIWETASALCYLQPTPDFTVHIYLEADAAHEANDWMLLKILFACKDLFPYILAGSSLIFLLCVIYLCFAAGRKRGSNKIHAGGLNRLPLDIYLFAISAAVIYILPIVEREVRVSSRYAPYWCIATVLTIGFMCSLLLVAFFFACVAQCKTPDGFFYKNAFVYRCLHRLWQCGCWLVRTVQALLRMIPTIWQWLLTALCMALSLLLTFHMAAGASYFRINESCFFLFLLVILGCFCLVCYGGWCFGVLIKGASAMAKGDLSKKVPTKYLYGAFKTFALELNSLADAAYIAAQNQMRSERMKTELITNVSHDIKTPLTSIINFVDLLQKPHTAEEESQYLDVLSRQSAQMKRLIDDLMDLSKAATGNMTVSIAQLDAVEAVNQALGEFADKLDAANLSPVFRHPDKPVTVNADGRLLWRVLSNLLSNIVKYSMTGTRVYLELTETDTHAILSLKNISREPLNLSADALMERFVQGDASRNTEGSGLGLNIAQSLMQVQKGSLSLHLDGDLFKVTLTLPKA